MKQEHPELGAPRNTKDQSAWGRPEARAWEILVHATPARTSPGFARRVAAAACNLPQDRPLSPVLRWGRVLVPLAAAATLLVSTGPLLLPPRSAASGTQDLDSLARMETALQVLPEHPGQADLDPALLEVASLDDPSALTDDQLFALLY